MKRLFVAGAQQGRLRLAGASFHHVARVLRAQVGESVELFDGRGQRYPARVVSIETEALELEVAEGHQEPRPRPLHVLQALPKADKLELVLQKGTELGVGVFHLVTAQRCVVKVSDGLETKMTRWRRIIEEAARQSGRAEVPELHAPASLEAVLAALPAGCATAVLDEEAQGLTLGAFTTSIDPHAPVAFAVGPEGGWAREEVAFLEQHGATPVTLGRSVLRTETAALAAAVIVRHLDGLLG